MFGTRRGLQQRDFGGNRHDRAEFRSLRVRTARQRFAGNARGEAQIVLDARRRAGLPAERVRIQHQDRQTFGRGVYGSREPCGAGADDRGVIRTVGKAVRQQAETPCEGFLVGIAQHRPIGTQGNGQLGLRNGKPLNNLVRVRVRRRVEHRAGDGIAPQEVLQAQALR